MQKSLPAGQAGRVNKKRERLVESVGLVVGPVLMVAGTGWMSDYWYAYILDRGAGLPGGSLAVFWAGLMIFCMGVMILGYLRKRYLPLRNLERLAQVRPCKVLVTCVSCTKEFTIEASQIKLLDGTVPFAFGKNLTEDCEVESRWNWQQLLRAVLRHKDSLEAVVLVGSGHGLAGKIQGAQNSYGQLSQARDLLYRYFDPQKVIVDCYERAVDFEDIDQLTDAFQDILRSLGERGYDMKQIMIDATAGIKTTSIAAAITTLDNASLHFQYVNNAGAVISFNASFQSPFQAG